MKQEIRPEDLMPEAVLPGYHPRVGWNAYISDKNPASAGWMVFLGGGKADTEGGNHLPWKAWNKAEMAVAKKFNGPLRELMSAVFFFTDIEETQVFIETRKLEVAYGAIVRRGA